jgi:hypothetical protein
VAVVKNDELSEADREFLERQYAASRRRRLRVIKANAIAVPITAVLSGVPGLTAFWYFGEWEVAAAASMPGLALAIHYFRKLHPDFAR